MEGSQRLAVEGDDVPEPEEVSPQNTDPRLLKEILPTEIWERVADKVLKGSSEDHSKFVNSSSFFQDLRKSGRTAALFKQVLPLVAKSVWKKEGLDGFPVKDVLNCRLVCKRWNSAVQKVVSDKFANSGKSFIGKGLNYFDNLVDIGRRFEVIQNERWIGNEWALEGRLLEDQYSIHKFLSHFRQSHAPNYRFKGINPFFCRKIELGVSNANRVRAPPDADYQPYLQAINEMLSNYGTQVDTFKVDSAQVPFLVEALPLLPKWLSMLPNLKRFQFIDRTWRRYGYIDLDDAQPLLKLKYLEKIWISGRPRAIFNQLIFENSHVSEIRLENPEIYQQLFTFPLPSLKKLNLVGCQREIVERLRSPQVQWPLEILKMEDIKFIGGWAGLFKVIQDKFAETLVSLKFEVSPLIEDVDGCLWEDCKYLRLELPKLKKVHISLDEMPVCLDFLLSMKNHLEEIEVSFGLVRQSRDERRLVIVQHSTCDRLEMLESNIWQIFKKLNKFHVIWEKTYWRKDWNDWVSNNELLDGCLAI